MKTESLTVSIYPDLVPQRALPAGALRLGPGRGRGGARERYLAHGRKVELKQTTIFAHDFLCVNLGHPAAVCFLFLHSSDRFHQMLGALDLPSSFAILVSQSTDVHIWVVVGVQSRPVEKLLMKFLFRLIYSNVRHVFSPSICCRNSRYRQGSSCSSHSRVVRPRSPKKYRFIENFEFLYTGWGLGMSCRKWNYSRIGLCGPFGPLFHFP